MVGEVRTHPLQQQRVDVAEVELHPHRGEMVLDVEQAVAVVLDVVLVFEELVYRVGTAEVLVLEQR